MLLLHSRAMTCKPEGLGEGIYRKAGLCELLDGVVYTLFCPCCRCSSGGAFCDSKFATFRVLESLMGKEASKFEMLALAKQRVRTHESNQNFNKHFSSIFRDNKLGIREIQRKTSLPYGTLYQKLKDPFKIEQPRGYPAYLSTSEIESLADKLKLPEHKQNGTTMPVLKTMVVDLLAGENREPLSGTISQAYADGLKKTLKNDFDVTFAAANRTSSGLHVNMTKAVANTVSLLKNKPAHLSLF
jgi:hypothetical protein